MQQTTEQGERITRYLLDDLPESEQAAVELEYFADQEKFEEVWAAENELIDRYVRGRLPRGERELFERNYLQSPKHRERVALARKLLEAADRQAPESGVAPLAGARAPSLLSRLMEALINPRMPRVLLPAAAFLLLISVCSWLAIERGRLNEELGKTKSQLSDQQRREQEIAGKLAVEREESGKLKSEIDRLLETVVSPPSQARPSILSFLLVSTLTSRDRGQNQQQITISRQIDLVRLQMKLEKEDSRKYQVSIRSVGGPPVWNQRSLKPRSGIITVNIPADKLPMDDYILTLSAATPSGGTEIIDRPAFRVIRK
ncbi:MAG TPA: hypothetical protein VJ810_00685 [Blastocatellia bacterium]|nr:hypothetical protein [Blastocatellia bacterium]